MKLPTFDDLKGVLAVLGKASDVAAKAPDIAQAVGDVAQDPALPDVVALALELHRLEQPSSPGAPEVKGVGLARIVPPLKAYVTTRRHPWIVPALATAALGLPFAVGYFIGREHDVQHAEDLE